jgi:hypothetical protein
MGAARPSRCANRGGSMSLPTWAIVPPEAGIHASPTPVEFAPVRGRLPRRDPGQ